MANEIDNCTIAQLHNAETVYKSPYRLSCKILSIIIPSIGNIFWQAHKDSLDHGQNVIQNQRFHQSQFIYITDQEDLFSKNHPQ